MDVTERQLARALEEFILIGRPIGGGHPLTVEVDDPGAIAAALYAALRRMTALHDPGEVVGAHICCGHAGDAAGTFADPEVAAMAALATVLPLVSALGPGARERVMDWARMRASGSLPPF